jgi:hypothetical protein
MSEKIKITCPRNEKVMSLRGGCSSRRSNLKVNWEVASGKEQARPRNDMVNERKKHEREDQDHLSALRA